MNKYVPFLKLKRAEIAALKEIDGAFKTKLTPFFDFPRKNDYTEASFKQATKNIINSINKHIETIPYFYLDNYDIDSTFTIDGFCNYHFLLHSFSNLPFIPVASTDRSQEHIDVISDMKKASEIRSNIIAIRFTPEYFANFMAIADDCQDMLGELIELFDDIDLVLDCRVCNGIKIEDISQRISRFINEFTHHYKVRKIIITGSSIPASIGEIARTQDEVEIVRNELLIFGNVFTSLGDSFNLTLGDYGIVSPLYSDIDIIPEAMLNIMSPKIIYPYDKTHFIMRGGALKTHPRQYFQYNDLANILVSKSFYRGAAYSFGDAYLDEKSKGIGPKVTPTTIIKPTHNAHITYMLKDYAN